MKITKSDTRKVHWWITGAKGAIASPDGRRLKKSRRQHCQQFLPSEAAMLARSWNHNSVCLSVAAISVGDWGGRAPKARGSRRWRRRGDRVSYSPLGEGSGDGAVPQNIFRFLSSKRRVLLHSGCYFAVGLNGNLGHWVACTDWLVMVTFWSRSKLKSLFLKMMIHDRPYTTGVQSFM